MLKRSLLTLLLIATASLVMVGCETITHTRTTVYVEDDGGPYNGAYYEYDYYPGAEVYYDTGRRIYYYHGPDGWVSSSSLPAHISLHLYRRHHFRSRHRHPYRGHRHHRRRFRGHRGHRRGRRR
jgi:hypothetical protein